MLYFTLLFTKLIAKKTHSTFGLSQSRKANKQIWMFKYRISNPCMCIYSYYTYEIHSSLLKKFGDAMHLHPCSAVAPALPLLPITFFPLAPTALLHCRRFPLSYPFQTIMLLPSHLL